MFRWSHALLLLVVLGLIGVGGLYRKLQQNEDSVTADPLRTLSGRLVGWAITSEQTVSEEEYYVVFVSTGKFDEYTRSERGRETVLNGLTLNNKGQPVKVKLIIQTQLKDGGDNVLWGYQLQSALDKKVHWPEGKMPVSIQDLALLYRSGSVWEMRFHTGKFWEYGIQNADTGYLTRSMQLDDSYFKKINNCRQDNFQHDCKVAVFPSVLYPRDAGL